MEEIVNSMNRFKESELFPMNKSVTSQKTDQMENQMANQSDIYNYGMFVLHASKNLQFFAGTVEYHNLILIGLSEMEEQGCLHIDWLEEENPGTSIILTRCLSLPEHLRILEDIYQRIPNAEGITVEKLLQDIYRFELNKQTTSLQQKLIDGMRERGMLKFTEKKRLFGKSKKMPSVNETAWADKRECIRKELDLESQSTAENPLSLSTFLLADLLCRGNMLPDLFGKKEAKHYWNQIISLNERPAYKESSFSRLLTTVREIEPELFNLVSLKMPIDS